MSNDEDDEKCIGNVDDPHCSRATVWRRSTQFSGDHPFCDAHARREKDFGQCDPTGGQFFWYARDPLSALWIPAPGERPAVSNVLNMTVDKPFSVTQFTHGAPTNHHTREPHQPTYATIVVGEYDPSVLGKIAYEVRLARKGPGVVEFTLTINGMTCGQLPFDNLVKSATRIDPDHAVGSELQIQKLRRETAEAKAAMYDWRAKAEQLEEKLRALTASG
jgi:hypothetical protein